MSMKMCMVQLLRKNMRIWLTVETDDDQEQTDLETDWLNWIYD